MKKPKVLKIISLATISFLLLAISFIPILSSKTKDDNFSVNESQDVNVFFPNKILDNYVSVPYIISESSTEDYNYYLYDSRSPIDSGELEKKNEKISYLEFDNLSQNTNYHLTVGTSPSNIYSYVNFKTKISPEIVIGNINVDKISAEVNFEIIDDDNLIEGIRLIVNNKSYKIDSDQTSVHINNLVHNSDYRGVFEIWYNDKVNYEFEFYFTTKDLEDADISSWNFMSVNNNQPGTNNYSTFDGFFNFYNPDNLEIRNVKYEFTPVNGLSDSIIGHVNRVSSDNRVRIVAENLQAGTDYTINVKAKYKKDEVVKEINETFNFRTAIFIDDMPAIYTRNFLYSDHKFVMSFDLGKNFDDPEDRLEIARMVQNIHRFNIIIEDSENPENFSHNFDFTPMINDFMRYYKFTVTNDVSIDNGSTGSKVLYTLWNNQNSNLEMGTNYNLYLEFTMKDNSASGVSTGNSFRTYWTRVNFNTTHPDYPAPPPPVFEYGDDDSSDGGGCRRRCGGGGGNGGPSSPGKPDRPGNPGPGTPEHPGPGQPPDGGITPNPPGNGTPGNGLEEHPNYINMYWNSENVSYNDAEFRFNVSNPWNEKFWDTEILLRNNSLPGSTYEVIGRDISEGTNIINLTDLEDDNDYELKVSLTYEIVKDNIDVIDITKFFKTKEDNLEVDTVVSDIEENSVDFDYSISGDQELIDTIEKISLSLYLVKDGEEKFDRKISLGTQEAGNYKIDDLKDDQDYLIKFEINYNDSKKSLKSEESFKTKYAAPSIEIISAEAIESNHTLSVSYKINNIHNIEEGITMRIWNPYNDSNWIIWENVTGVYEGVNKFEYSYLYSNSKYVVEIYETGWDNENGKNLPYDSAIIGT